MLVSTVIKAEKPHCEAGKNHFRTKMMYRRLQRTRRFKPQTYCPSHFKAQVMNILNPNNILCKIGTKEKLARGKGNFQTYFYYFSL